MPETMNRGWQEWYDAARDALQRRALDDAEHAMAEALRAAELEPESPRLATTLNALARIRSMRGQPHLALALLDRLADVQARALGASHPQLAGVLTNIAELHARLGDRASELAARRRALEIRVTAGDADDATLERMRARIATLVESMPAEPIAEAAIVERPAQSEPETIVDAPLAREATADVPDMIVASTFEPESVEAERPEADSAAPVGAKPWHEPELELEPAAEPAPSTTIRASAWRRAFGFARVRAVAILALVVATGALARAAVTATGRAAPAPTAEPTASLDSLDAEPAATVANVAEESPADTAPAAPARVRERRTASAGAIAPADPALERALGDLGRSVDSTIRASLDSGARRAVAAPGFERRKIADAVRP